ncbi:GCN5 family acetyltransferase [Elstera litoralis]|uniref:GCN5 family acetyltransferase n=1 Tax=Elstera litoralis TaxID=552518 RepID=A0A0F3IS31_9PROT|nr:arsinothricin resistance N-acetyltransferase ArsN1 family A [Elstera litoralis]KJV08399.1 GCN5 family acetyltransferase [Elstera litoralis]
MITTRPAEPQDAEAIARIYSLGIAERTATFDTEPRTAADILPKIDASARFPQLVAVDAGGTVLGWVGTSAYRARDCYRGIGEFSIYLDPAARGQGIGKLLLTALVDAARAAGFWKLLSRIFTFNHASLAVCHACGFRDVGAYEKHGKLDGRWLDVVIVERLIPENLT